ncbi:MAG: 2-isopropylmalate synthase [Myxococcota bacterium]
MQRRIPPPSHARHERPGRVRVLDTTLRDGEQAAGVAFEQDDKLEIARALEALGVDWIEAGFPRACPSEFESVRSLAREIRGTSICALARALEADIDCAAEALEPAAAPRLHVFVSASHVHLDHQLGRDVGEVCAMTRHAVARARRHTDDVEFSPMDATRADPRTLARIVEAAVRAGARTINLPDTVGCARPAQVNAMIRGLRERVSSLAKCTISFHGHDDLGLATANTLAAIEAGARQVEVTVNGIGERAGNAPLEEVVVALRAHREAIGVDSTLDPRGLWSLGRLVEERSRMRVAPNKAVIGRNAFRHASGIHQDGVLKHPGTYETVDPRSVGAPDGSRIVLGKLSGRHGFDARLRALGLRVDGEALDALVLRCREIAERSGEVCDDDLRRLAGSRRVCSPEGFPGPGV